MKEKYFKAKIPFSSGTGIYNPGDTEPGKADASLVDAWVEAGYVEIVGKVEEMKIKEIEPKDGFKQFDYEAPSDTTEALKDEVIQLPQEDEKEAENAENEPKNNKYDAMKYPQLKKAAKEAGIKGYNTMKQADLIKALKGV